MSLSATYTYDVAHRLETETYNGTTVTYTYDDTDQLTGDGSNAYSYDLNGNRTMTGYQTGNGNRLTNDGTWTYTYDDEGNTTKKSKGTNQETWTYGYDHRNQLVWVEKRATDGGTLQLRADYKYDVFGSRIEKAVDDDGSGPNGTTTTRFVLDGWKVKQDSLGNRTEQIGNENWDVWADLDGSNALQMRYLRGDAVDELFARVSSGGTAAWYLQDRLGSVRDMTDNAGALQNHIGYDGFGKVASESGPSFGDRYKFTGREYNGDVGLYDYRARPYDAMVGSFRVEDQLRFAVSDSNLYRYVGNDPLSAVDASGLSEEEVGEGVMTATLRPVPYLPPGTVINGGNISGPANWDEAVRYYLGLCYLVDDIASRPTSEFESQIPIWGEYREVIRCYAFDPEGFGSMEGHLHMVGAAVDVVTLGPPKPKGGPLGITPNSKPPVPLGPTHNVKPSGPGVGFPKPTRPQRPPDAQLPHHNLPGEPTPPSGSILHERPPRPTAPTPPAAKPPAPTTRPASASPAPKYMPSAEVRTSLPRISKIAPDYATKGVHIHVKGVELKVLPGEGGKVVFKPVFSKDAKVAEAAIKEAQEALADPAFRTQLHDTATRATEYLRTSGLEGAAAKSGETNFLRIALEKMGLE
jgi:RHS repeat-associated protein